MTKKSTPESADQQNIVEFPQGNGEAAARKHAVTEDNVTANELTSIKALTSYVAHNKNVPENIVSAYLQAEFNVGDIADIRRADYERVIKFLVDLRKDLLIN